jgi:hypothetical protein
MPTKKRDRPPQNLHRFNYWEFFCPGGLKTIAPLKQHIQHTFNLLLNASPAVWNKEVRLWLHKDVSTIRNRPLYALKYYVEHDKEWESDKTAQAVLKQLSSRQKAAILRHFRTTWPARSKRPARLMRTWKTLLESIAGDQESFLKYLARMPDGRGVSEATKQRIYQHYSKQAIKLLGGGGTYISPARRNDPKLLTLLNARGRIDIPSIFPVDLLNCKSNDERREAKKLTLHWFHHALHNLREYRNGRPEIPWTAECEKQCRRIQQKLLNA